MAFLALEAIGLIIGWSLTVDSLNFLQIILHFVGVLFSAWFLIDSWQYSTIWTLWTFFGLIPMIVEFGVFTTCCKMGNDIDLNSKQVTYFHSNAQ